MNLFSFLKLLMTLIKLVHFNKKQIFYINNKSIRRFIIRVHPNYSFLIWTCTNNLTFRVDVLLP